jgi:hypothetical protein
MNHQAPLFISNSEGITRLVLPVPITKLLATRSVTGSNKTGSKRCSEFEITRVLLLVATICIAVSEAPCLFIVELTKKVIQCNTMPEFVRAVGGQLVGVQRSCPMKMYASCGGAPPLMPEFCIKNETRNNWKYRFIVLVCEKAPSDTTVV